VSHPTSYLIRVERMAVDGTVLEVVERPAIADDCDKLLALLAADAARLASGFGFKL